mmetsp:Transcript_105606/g.297112  ORF Transcript_105606/g.297112 Transcript_105606/m.297112 type:complete len:89 (+) Transcript_105606:615-881(+)
MSQKLRDASASYVVVHVVEVATSKAGVGATVTAGAGKTRASGMPHKTAEQEHGRGQCHPLPSLETVFACKTYWKSANDEFSLNEVNLS